MALEFVGHMTNAAVNMSHALLSPPPRHSAVINLPAPLMVVLSYVIVLVVLIVLGRMGWQRRGGGGNGNGGGGNRRPRSQQPTPPGGLAKTAEPLQESHTSDFAAWEEQLRGTDQEHVQNS
jgi:hypothetical protein